MTECTNEGMRDLLPLLARAALPAADAARVQAHVETCAACRTELALLVQAGRAIDATAPRVDVAAVTAAVRRATLVRVEAPTRARPATATRRAWPRLAAWAPRRAVAMAASLLLVATASLTVLSRLNDPDVRAGGAAASSDSASGARLVASAGMSVPGGLAELSDDDLVALLDELDRVEATINAEPVSMRQAIVDVPEEF